MSYSLEEIAGTLRAARKNKQLSQRELSAKVGMPQSHISKIENASVDLKLSSLSELARALELELVLVPKKALPAVQSLIRTSGTENPVVAKSSPEGRAIRKLKRSAEKLQKVQPNLQALRDMQQTADTLNRIPLPDALLSGLEKIASQMDKIQKQLESLKPYTLDPAAGTSIRRLSIELTEIRNQTVDAIKFPDVTLHARPAYQLPADDEDDDG